jgi:outer membrane protein OmpA-like peptidoglycan-associated protein
LLYPDIRIKITGHTDNVGNNEYNLNLSKDRAKSVKGYLVSKGVKENRIEIDGKGETEPLKSNETESNRSINRRVEFEIIE